MSFVLAALFSIFFTWFVFYRQFKNNPDNATEFIEANRPIFWYTYVLILLSTSFVMSIFWRTFFGMGLTFAIISVFTYANTQKLQVRSAPIIPEDLAMIEQTGNLVEFVDADELNRLIWGIALLLMGTWLLDYYCRKVIGKNTDGMQWWERHAIVQRATFAVSVYAAFVVLFDPIVHHKGSTSEEVSWLNTLFLAWNPTVTYERNGLLLSFLYSAGSTRSEEPADYSKERITEIYKKYHEQQERDINTSDLSSTVDNVVLILSETFYDPEILGEYYAHYGGDVVPNLHRLFQNHASGYMYSPEYGGGTANVEYAVYTGLSNYWANTIAYSNFAAGLEYIPGLVSYVGEDFGKTAVHAYDGAMYKRNTVYNKMGYDEFLDQSKMKYTELENDRGYISDRSVYNQVYDLLKDSDGPQLVGVATMQNHAPYTSAQYSENHFIMRERVDDWGNIESSFESLHNADKYLGEFIEKLDQLDEKTVVIWFGDHAAGVLNRYVESGDPDLINLAHLTPYFIYTNFEADSLFTEKEVAEINQLAGFVFETEGVDLPVMTPNCVSNLAYNVLNVKKPVISYLLDTVCAEAPILASSYFGDATPEVTEALAEYELINYDISNGKRYWLEFDLN